MSAVSELATMQRSFSADKTVKYQSRSGDEQGGGATILDYVASVQSAEADIIEAEEREEQRQAKREFARLLRAYFKKLLTVEEYIFLAACMRGDRTPYAVGRSLGINYNAAIASINAKHKENLPKLLRLMRAVGYDCRRGIVFIPKLNYYIKRAEQKRNAAKTYAKRYPGLKRERCKTWREANRERQAEYNREYRRNRSDELREAENARKRERRAANREEYNARAREKYHANAEARRAAYRERYRKRTEEQRAKHRKRDRLAHQRARERKREEINDRQRLYREQNPERYRNYDKERRVKARAAREETKA